MELAAAEARGSLARGDCRGPRVTWPRCTHGAAAGCSAPPAVRWRCAPAIALAAYRMRAGLRGARP